MTYEWAEEGWRYIQRSADRDPWVGVTVTFSDTLGTLRTGSLGSATITDDGFAYALPEAQDLRNGDAWYRLALGYVTTMDHGHVAFLPAEPPAESAAWATFIADLRESPDGVPMQVEPTLWTATLPGHSITFFEAWRRADVQRGCPALEYYEGVIDGSSGEPVVATSSSGDCDGKGATSRAPVALIEREGRLYLLVSTYGWEESGAELWEADDAGLTLVRLRN